MCPSCCLQWSPEPGLLLAGPGEGGGGSQPLGALGVLAMALGDGSVEVRRRRGGGHVRPYNMVSFSRCVFLWFY